jgi:hypothetical protein
MQAELERLERDIQELESVRPSDVPALVKRIRARAGAEAPAMFGNLQ